MCIRDSDCPTRDIPGLSEFTERWREDASDFGQVFVLADVEQLAEGSVGLLETAGTHRGVKPDLQKRHQSLGDVVPKPAIYVEIDRKLVVCRDVVPLPLRQPNVVHRRN